MNHLEKSAKEKIIFAVIKCIETEGIHAVTVRSIAKEANVNIAAINYYFGTKDKLIEETLKYTANHIFLDSLEVLEGMSKNPYYILQSLLTYYLEGMLKFPGLSKAHLYSAFTHDDYEGAFSKQLNAFLGDLHSNIENHIPKEDDKKDSKIAIVQMISAVMLPGLFPGLFYDFTGIDFRNSEKQKEYVNCLLKHFFKNE